MALLARAPDAQTEVSADAFLEATSPSNSDDPDGCSHAHDAPAARCSYDTRPDASADNTNVETNSAEVSPSDPTSNLSLDHLRNRLSLSDLQRSRLDVVVIVILLHALESV